MVAVGCETEPVSNNDEFLAFAKKVLEAVEADGPGCGGRSSTKSAWRLSGKLGENIVVAGAARFEAVNGALIEGYAHPPANKLGVLVQVRGGSDEHRAQDRDAHRSLVARNGSGGRTSRRTS